MDKLEFTKDEEVVYCPGARPKCNSMRELPRFRGADGKVASRETKGSGNKKKVKSVLVKWRIHRKGISCFRVRGKKRAKSDWMEAFRQGKRHFTDTEVTRFEETAQNIHPISYCRDCPLRLSRLVTPCRMSKTEAIHRFGTVKEDTDT